MIHDVSVIVPWRDSGDPHRQANLTCVLDHLAETGWPLILADDRRTDGPFNRSAAYNHGMELSPSNVYVFHEADMLVPLDQLALAIDEAHTYQGLIVPFMNYRYMGPEASRLILSGVKPETLFPDRIMEGGTAVGAVGVVSAETMQAIGRWDEKFSGHGFDDRAMHRAFEVAAGPTRFVGDSATHLWHHPAYSPWERASKTEASKAGNYSYAEVEATVRNRARLRSYRAASRPEHIRALTSGES